MAENRAGSEALEREERWGWSAEEYAVIDSLIDLNFNDGRISHDTWLQSFYQVGGLPIGIGVAAVSATIKAEAAAAKAATLAKGEAAVVVKSEASQAGSVLNQPLGLGSTGRTVPKSLNEQLAMKQAMSDPTAGNILRIELTDPRWPAAEGWKKMVQNINGIKIHYVRNFITGAVDDFKFK